MIKTTPMIFNSEMVRALLAGNKTQTRRIFKQPKADNAFVIMISDKETAYAGWQ